jgi:hypothetical protein
MVELDQEGRRDDVGCRVGRAGTLVTVIDADMGVR